MTDAAMTAMIALYAPLDRLGPGDEALTRAILAELPRFPEKPRIADLGCGTGEGALLLAKTFDAPVTAVDLSAEFLGTLRAKAAEQGVAELIHTVEADMGALDWPPGSVDLLWSEGAAYNLGFSTALEAWRPLLAPGGWAVVSDMNWFCAEPPQAARDYWQAAGLQLDTEQQAIAKAQQAGFIVERTHRLPADSWWRSYYDPLSQRMAELKPTADAVMSEVIREIELEQDMFRQHSDAYGYTFYVMRAA
jgi:serine/threonine-protein kinase HipA